MLDPQKKEPVPEGALRRGTSDYDSQDSKSHNSQKQKQVASDDDGGNGVDGVGSSSSGSSSQSRRGPANGQYAGSDLPAAEDLTLVEEYTDHTTITAEASRNIGVAAKAKDLDTSLLTRDEMKKLQHMAEPPPINFCLDGGPIQFGNINDDMLRQSSSNGDMVDGSKQSIGFTPSFAVDPHSGSLNPSGDACVSNADNAPQEPCTSELGLEDSPPLTHPSVSSWSSREKKLYAKCAKVEAQLKESREHGYYSSKRQLIICAAEILKWSVGLKGEERGHGMQFFRANLNKPVQEGSDVMGMLKREYQELSQRCIMNRNATAHFETLKALEEAVYHSACDIELYSQFRKELPDQCLVIERFEAFKKAFPCFHLEELA